MSSPLAQRAAPHSEQEDKILAAASDLIGIFHVIKMGKGVYLRLCTALSLILGASAAVMVSARYLGKLVEAVTLAKGGDLVAKVADMHSDLWFFAACFLALESLSVGCQYFGRVYLAGATIQITYKIRTELFSKMQRLPISYFDSQPLGRTITRLTSDVEGVENFFNGTMARVLIACINIVTVLVAMLVTDVQFGGKLVAVCIPTLAFSVAFRKPVIYWLRTYKRRSAHLNAKLAEYLGGMPVIQLFGLESWTLRQFEEAAQSLLRAGIMTMNWNSIIRPLAVLLCTLPLLLTLWVGGEKVLAGTMELGVLVAFVRYSERFVAPIRTISTEIQNIQEAVVSSERVRRMLEEEEEDQVLGEEGKKSLRLQGRVSYQDVWMRYRADKRPVLKGISFEVAAGMRIGLVGATGSGKSSTINLLPQLYPLLKGQILLDGVPLGEISRTCVRSQLGYVSQDVVVFAGTLRANLLASVMHRSLTDAEILTACEKTGLSEVVAAFPGGLDHVMVEHGDNLSMGERQLIAFTRMLLRDPRILILDEATANIDEHCEVLLQQATAEVMQGRTCFIIAHRLSTIIGCDKILVFARGQVVEEGSHQELLARGGYYAELATKQLTNTQTRALL